MDISTVEFHLKRAIQDGLGFDLNDPNLKDTPKRIAKMYCNEFFKNVGKEFTDFSLFPNSPTYNQIIMSDRIYFTSMCSHHFLPFSGHAWLLYIPNNHLIGLSKMARLIKHYSARPQLQEQLCNDILFSFTEAVKPLGAMLVMKATHCCMSCRGVYQYNGAGMVTSQISGCFLEFPEVKQEGLELIKLSIMDK